MTGVVVVSWIVFAFAVAVVLICASVLLQRWADKKARKEKEPISSPLRCWARPLKTAGSI